MLHCGAPSIALQQNQSTLLITLPGHTVGELLVHQAVFRPSSPQHLPMAHTQAVNKANIPPPLRHIVPAPRRHRRPGNHWRSHCRRHRR